MSRYGSMFHGSLNDLNTAAKGTARDRLDDLFIPEIEIRLAKYHADWLNSVQEMPRSPSDFWWELRKLNETLYKLAPGTLQATQSADPAGDRERYEDCLASIAAMAIEGLRSIRSTRPG